MLDLRMKIFKAMHPYQIEGVEFVEKRGGLALIGDPMGLGKTIQSLGYLALHPEDRPVLVIMPAAVKFKWKREIEKWLDGENIQVISGRKPVKITGSIVLINWDILHYKKKIIKFVKKKEWGIRFGRRTMIWKTEKKEGIGYEIRKDLRKTKWKIMIPDEIQKIANNGKARTETFKLLAKRIKKIIPLSGTPMKNRPMDFFNILNILDPINFPNRFKFGVKFCDGTETSYGWNFKGSSNTDLLHKLVSNIMIRREKSEVTDLPPKTRIVIPLELSNRETYNKLDKQLRILAKSPDAPPAIQLTAIEKLKQCSVNGKIKAAIDWIKEYLEVEEKLVVFCVHKQIVSILVDKLKKYNPLTIVGGVDAAEKDRRAELFQNDPKHRVMIGNIPSASEGIDLFAANATFTLELMWGPSIHDQSEDRVHRIGQKSEHCFAYYGLGVGTIDEPIALLIDKKRKIIDKVIDGKKTDRESMLFSLMKTYKEE